MLIMLHGYSRQRRTIGSFAATAGLQPFIVNVFFINTKKLAEPIAGYLPN